MQTEAFGWICRDCGADTIAGGECYMVADEVWQQSGLEYHDGKLCIGCLEERLGRQLNSSDFIWCLLNVKALLFGSERMQDRLGGARYLLCRHSYQNRITQLTITDDLRLEVSRDTETWEQRFRRLEQARATRERR
jgi:hypothetical protein